MPANEPSPKDLPDPPDGSEPSELDATLARESFDPTLLEPEGEGTHVLESKSTPFVQGLQLGELLGAGAMGEVFAGRQEYLNRDVAVKMLGERCSSAAYQSRFKREATLLAGLTHENIVACYDAGISADGRCYLVMERVLGPSLASWVAENGPLSPAAALRVTVELARALQHAYRKCTIIHRDVKPANVLLAPVKEPPPDGFPFAAKLADLGLARPADTEVLDMGLTAEGVILGTPSTMAPEQFDDPRGVDCRADIYALGCVLYYSLTGKSAFRGKSLSQIVQAKMVELGPDAVDLRPDVPALMAQLARRMMSARASDRPQTYKEVLEACIDLDPDVSRSASGYGPNKWLILGALSLGFLAGALGYWKFAKEPKAQGGPGVPALPSNAVSSDSEQASAQTKPALLADQQPASHPAPETENEDALAATTSETPKVEQLREVPVSVEGPARPEQLSSTAPPLTAELNLIVAEDYGGQPRYWTHREGGRQFGQLSADEGLLARSASRRTLHTIDLPGGAWIFQGQLAVSEGELLPERIGIVITHPGGRRHELNVTEGKPPQLEVQSFSKSSDGTTWMPQGDPKILGSVDLGEAGLPLSASWVEGTLEFQVGSLRHSVVEPSAPATLGFSVQGGTGELRVPKLLPR